MAVISEGKVMREEALAYKTKIAALVGDQIIRIADYKTRVRGNYYIPAPPPEIETIVILDEIKPADPKRLLLGQDIFKMPTDR